MSLKVPKTGQAFHYATDQPIRSDVIQMRDPCYIFGIRQR